MVELHVPPHVDFSGTRLAPPAPTTAWSCCPNARWWLERWAAHVQGLGAPWLDSVVRLALRKGKRK
jgi:hypothetical protein